MITRKDLITEKQLIKDIKELSKNYNSGRSKAMAGVFSLNDRGRRKRIQWVIAGKKRRAQSPKAISSGSTNGIRISNLKLKHQIESMKAK